MPVETAQACLTWTLPESMFSAINAQMFWPSGAVKNLSFSQEPESSRCPFSSWLAPRSAAAVEERTAMVKAVKKIFILESLKNSIWFLSLCFSILREPIVFHRVFRISLKWRVWFLNVSPFGSWMSRMISCSELTHVSLRSGVTPGFIRVQDRRNIALSRNELCVSGRLRTPWVARSDSSASEGLGTIFVSRNDSRIPLIHILAWLCNSLLAATNERGCFWLRYSSTSVLLVFRRQRDGRCPCGGQRKRHKEYRHSYIVGSNWWAGLLRLEQCTVLPTQRRLRTVLSQSN